MKNKSPDHHNRIVDRYGDLQVKLRRDSISTGAGTGSGVEGGGPYPGPGASGQTRVTSYNVVPPTPKASQPDGIPNAEQDPEAFVIWATKLMDTFDDVDDLSNIWETEICPAAEGIFKPDFDSMQAYYDKRLAKLGA